MERSATLEELAEMASRLDLSAAESLRSIQGQPAPDLPVHITGSALFCEPEDVPEDSLTDASADRDKLPQSSKPSVFVTALVSGLIGMIIGGGGMFLLVREEVISDVPQDVGKQLRAAIVKGHSEMYGEAVTGALLAIPMEDCEQRFSGISDRDLKRFRSYHYPDFVQKEDKSPDEANNTGVFVWWFGDLDLAASYFQYAVHYGHEKARENLADLEVFMGRMNDTK